jgi:hypothetical protein
MITEALTISEPKVMKNAVALTARAVEFRFAVEDSDMRYL